MSGETRKGPYTSDLAAAHAMIETQQKTIDELSGKRPERRPMLERLKAQVMRWLTDVHPKLYLLAFSIVGLMAFTTGVSAIVAGARCLGYHNDAIRKPSYAHCTIEDCSPDLCTRTAACSVFCLRDANDIDGVTTIYGRFDTLQDAVDGARLLDCPITREKPGRGALP